MPGYVLKNRSRATLLTLVPICFLSILTALVYSNTLSTPFLFDDIDYIKKDSAIHMNEFSGTAVKMAFFKSKPRLRPLSNFSFAVNYFFGKHDVWGYHLVNIAIHMLAGLCLFGFINTVLSTIPPAPGYVHFLNIPPFFIIAFFAAFIWMVHPVNTQSVTYLVQRMTSLGAFFYILSLWMYALARNAWCRIEPLRLKSLIYISGFITAGICAFASKENTATLPVSILMYEWIFHQDMKIRWTKSKTCWIGITAIIFVGLIFYFTGGSPIHRILEAYTRRDFTLGERMMTECRVLIYYLSLFLYPKPSRLNLDYDFPLSLNPLNPSTTLISLMALTALLILALYKARTHKILTFTVLWFFLTLLIESSIVGIEIIFEHRTYLPFMMLCLLISDWIFRHFRPKLLAALLLCGIGILFSAWTYQRNTTWQTSLTLWSDCATKSPQNTRALTQLGDAHRNSGQTDQAISVYRLALTIDPCNAVAHNNLANIFALKNNFHAAEFHLIQAIRHDPKPVMAHHNLGNILVRQGKLKQAIAHYTKAIEINPQYLPAKRMLQQLLPMLDNSLSGE